MLILRLVSVLALLLALQVYADLDSDLRALNVDAVFSGDAKYDNAIAPFNIRFRYLPAAITYPNTPSDISKILQLGAKYNKNVVPRSGGHSYIANGIGGKDGSIVVDMLKFKTVIVNKDDTAVIGTGNRLGDIALALYQHNRAMPHGACPYVGIGGHASYGGFGFLSRKWGLAMDVIQSIDIVLANGTITTVSQNRDPDLFWAMRGAGASFAISTALNVKTFTAPTSGIISRRTWFLTPTAAAFALQSFQNFAHTNTSLPADFGGEFVFTPGPNPGLVTFELFSGFWGPQQQFNSTLEPWMKTMPFAPNHTWETQGDYIQSLVARAGVTAKDGTLNTSVAPDIQDTYYVKSLVIPEISSKGEVGLSLSASRNFFEYLASEGSRAPVSWFIELELWGGKNSAINAVAKDATSFAHRDQMWTMQVYSYTWDRRPPFPDSGLTFTDGILNSILGPMGSDWSYGAYMNYVDDRLQNWQHLYYDDHYTRLQTIKSKYDPSNIFSFPIGIQPAAKSS